MARIPLPGSRLASVLAFSITANAALGQKTRVPTPVVTGPIAAASVPGTPDHAYPFFATTAELAHSGYVEEEFFIEGRAHKFTFAGSADGIPSPTDYPYKTRLIVRRPRDPQRFNGTVLVEWLNVSGGFDIDIEWIQASEHLLRSGYAWVGVSVQRVGVHAAAGLRAWAPERYGTLDVTGGGTVLADSLQFDIYSQAGQAIRSSGPKSPLGPLVPRLVLAIGQSQSAQRLVTYYNRIQPSAGVFDAFLIHGGGVALRTDLSVKAFKITAETDLTAMGQAAAHQPDTDVFRVWEVAGSSHADFHYATAVHVLQERDFGRAIPHSCARPTLSRIPLRYVLYKAIDDLVTWATSGKAPPIAPRITLAANGPAGTVARDTLGNALGGIRLPQHAVPTAQNTGENTGGQFCAFYGSHEPFDSTRLAVLYPTHDVYVRAVSAAADRLVQGGFLLAVDADAIKQEAQRSPIGKR